VYPGPISQAYIVNNTFAFPNPHRDGHIIVDATLTTGVIANNVFYQPQTAGVWFSGGTTSNVTVNHNLTMGGTASTGAARGSPSRTTSTTPTRRSSTSGAQLSAPGRQPGHRRRGDARLRDQRLSGREPAQGAAYDIGAFEFH